MFKLKNIALPPPKIKSQYSISNVILIHPLQPDADRAPVRFEFLDLGQLHHGAADVAESLGREVGAGDMFGEGAEVDAGVLFGVAVCG